MSALPTIDRHLADWAERTPDAVAVVTGELRLTHGELQRLARTWAAVLRARGAGPGVMVGLHVERSHHTVIGIAAILAAGASYVPLEPSYPLARLRFIARDANVALIVTETARADSLGLDIPALCLDDAPPHCPVADARPPTSADIAYVTYTSGSTGTPKGVPMPHRGICQSLLWLQGKFPYCSDDRALLKSPLGFDVSSRWEILWPLASGGSIAIARPGGAHDPAYLAQMIMDTSVSIMHFVPSMLEVFLDEPMSARCHSLRRVFSGGEALSHTLKRRFFARLPDCELIDIYGATETIVVTYRQCRRDDPGHERPVGWPIADLPVYLLDNERQPVAPGEAGEIYVGGEFLASGYLGRPELTAERFILGSSTRIPGSDRGSDAGNEILFKTGDWARQLPGGEFEHLGRQDHQVKVRGVRIELSEIEAALASSPHVDRAVVTADVQPGRNTRLVAYVRSAEDAERGPTAPVEHLRAHLRQMLPAPMLPSQIVLVDSFPLNANGKIDRLALARLQVDSTAYAEPETSTETRIVAIWQRLLGVAHIGREDDFYSVGGDSLLAMRLLVHIRKEFGIDLPPQHIATSLTVADLARCLDAAQVHRHRDHMSVEELQAEVRLASDTTVSAPASSASNRNAQEVLLTGATGFLGAFVLAELLEQTGVIVHCLVREQPGTAMESLVGARDRYGLAWTGENQRVRPFRGDLGQPRLGLAADAFVRLGMRVDAMYHVGAQVNEALTYARLRAVNVGGTGELLRLATIGSPAQLHFVSTTAVFESSGYLDGNPSDGNPSDGNPNGDDPIDDDAALDAAERVYGGYAQSKWVAEKLVMDARLRGVSATIYRPGAISGHSRTGHMAWNQFLGCLLRGVIVQRAAPVIDAHLTFTPVDFVSRAIVHLSRQNWALNRNFNLVNPESITMSELAQVGRALGYPIALRPYRSWVDDVAQAIIDDVHHPLGSVFPLLAERIPGTDRSALEWSNITARARGSAIPALAQVGIVCPPVNADLLSLYLGRASEEIVCS